MATTWSAHPVAHLGPIKETRRPRTPHAPMYDAHSPMHSNEYHFYVNGGNRGLLFEKINRFFFRSIPQNEDKLLENKTLNPSITGHMLQNLDAGMKMHVNIF